MIPTDPKKHRAYYDEQGNIILPEEQLTSNQKQWEVIDTDAATPDDILVHEDAPEEPKPVPKSPTLRSIVDEGKSQYSATFKEGKTVVNSLHSSLRKSLSSSWKFALQPVWVVKKDAKPKEYSRLSLFCFDSVRFAMTFATIFAGLYVALNYESFMQIASERLNPIEHARNTQALTATVDASLKDKLLRSPILATAGSEGDLLSVLPEVGPPENRIIIPKLGLNIPLVTPSYESLLQEDWTQLEHDIQDALKMGVVHYPGTAKPGQAGNFFVTGHSSYYPWAPGKYKTIFARLHELSPGDEYWVYYGGDKHRFIVRSKKEVKPSNVSVLDQPLDRRISTLMTCTPIGTTLRRLILSAEEVDPVTGITLSIGEKGQRPLPAVKTQMLPI